MSFGEFFEEDSSDNEPQQEEKQSDDNNRDHSKEIKPPEGLKIFLRMDDGSMVMLVGSRAYSCDQRESDGVLYVSNFVAIPSRNDNGNNNVMERVLEIISSECTALPSPLPSTTHKSSNEGVHPCMENYDFEKRSSVSAVMTLMNLMTLMTLVTLVTLMTLMNLMNDSANE